MNQTDPTADFDGCRRACRQQSAHTLVRGECEHAPEPEPTVSLSRVYTDTDGRKSIGFDAYTVPELAELITAGLRASDLPVNADDFVDIASVAAYTIVHRNDEPAAVSAVVAPPTDRATLLAEVATALTGRRCSPESVDIVRRLVNERLCTDCQGYGQTVEDKPDGGIVRRCRGCNGKGLRRLAVEHGTGTQQQDEAETRTTWTPGPVAVAQAAEWARQQQPAAADGEETQS